jgi:hypothetical protein
MSPGLRSVSVTPGITPPEASVTVPPTAPTACASATDENPGEKSALRTIVRRRTILVTYRDM